MKWGKTQVSKACIQTRIRDPRKSPNKSFKYVDISAIDRDLKAIISAPEITGEEAPSRAKKEIHEGDILVSTVRPNLNAVAMVPPYLHGQIASTGFCVLRPNPEAVIGKYLFYYTTTPSFVGILSNKVRGAHYPAVSDSDVREVELPLPPLSEQRRIVEILDQADALRKKRAEADAKAARILPALFYQMFGDPATNPKGWRTGQLGNIISNTQYGTSARANTDGVGLPIIRMNNIGSDGYLDLTDMKYVDISDREYRKHALVKGDILFNRTNSRELVGKTGLWTGMIKAVPASYLIRVCVDSEKALPEFVWAYMNCPFIKQILLNNSRRAIGMANINARELRSLPLILPPIDQQTIFREYLDGLEETCKQSSHSIKIIEKIFSVLIHRAFAGDLTAKWREAHMKELLEEMEQQAKALGRKAT